jgi:mRNA-degrading endonuclease RelE of RelBE toxin-antitoxin system
MLVSKSIPIITLQGLEHTRLRKSIVDNFVVVYFYDDEKELVNIIIVIYAKRDYIKVNILIYPSKPLELPLIEW